MSTAEIIYIAEYLCGCDDEEIWLEDYEDDDEAEEEDYEAWLEELEMERRDAFYAAHDRTNMA